MDSEQSIFEQHTRSYLDQIGRLDLESIKDRLAVAVEDRTITVPVFGRPYRVSPEGIYRPDGNPADYTTTVIVCRYLLHSTDVEPIPHRWQSFKDFPDAAPLVGYFSVNVEAVIARHFSGRLDRLRNRVEQLGGRPHPMELSSDLVVGFDALPRVPIVLVFTDADEEFAATSTVLFESRARHYLDMECLGMIGSLLVEQLKRST